VHSASAARAYAGLSKHAATDGRLLVAFEKVYAGGVHVTPPCAMTGVSRTGPTPLLNRAAMGPRMHGSLPPLPTQSRFQVGSAPTVPRMPDPRPSFQLQSHVPQLRSVSAPCAARPPALNSAIAPNPAVACSRAQPRPASAAPGWTTAPPFPELAAHLDPCALVVTATEPASTASVVRAESLVSDLCVRSSPLSIDAARALMPPPQCTPGLPRPRTVRGSAARGTWLDFASRADAAAALSHVGRASGLVEVRHALRAERMGHAPAAFPCRAGPHARVVTL
jgi:hypothetical protein